MSPTNKINQLLLLASKVIVLTHEAFLAYCVSSSFTFVTEIQKWWNQILYDPYHTRVQPFKESALQVGFVQYIKKFSKSWPDWMETLAKLNAIDDAIKGCYYYIDLHQCQNGQTNRLNRFIYGIINVFCRSCAVICFIYFWN